MSQSEWTLENALYLACECLREYLPAVLSSMSATDAARANPLYGPAGLPAPRHIGAAEYNDLAADLILPSVWITAQTTQYQNSDASSILRANTTVTATIGISDLAAGTADANIFQNVLSAYQHAVLYVLSTVWVGPTGSACGAGVMGFTPQNNQFSPIIQAPESPVFIRFSQLEGLMVHRILNHWEV